MNVSISWLKELVDLNVSINELITLLPIRTIGLKEVNEDFIELDMKGYNRADLLSMRGVAYEVAALTDSPLRFLAQTPKDFTWASKDLQKVKVEIQNEKLVTVYCVAKIEKLKVEPSNKELAKRLTDCDMRPVNNIADITNLVMLEYGQPMHAFDAKAVSNETIIVNLASQGDSLQTLDGKLRKLDKSDLLIADPQKTLGLAGVMGGKDSEVSDSTTTILLEAAIFDPVTIRKTATRLGLRSEASKRFEHGLSKIRLLQALDAAIRMYQDLGGKLTAINLVGNFETTEKKLDLRVSKVNSLMGIPLDEETITNCLTKLNFSVNLASHSTSGNVILEVAVPYFRLDINIEEDLIEEVARIYGYEQIPSKPLEGELPEKLDQSLPNFIYDLKKTLAGAGLTEVQTYSFYSTQVLRALGFDETNQDEIIKVTNPISAETEYLRTFIWPNLVEVVAKNIKQGYKDIAVFELGKVYMPQRGKLPKEIYRLAIALMNGTDNPIEELLTLQGEALRAWKVEKGGLVKKMEKLEALFHPNKYATVKANNRVIGKIAEVHPRFLNHFGIDKRVAILEISLPQQQTL